MVRGSIWVSDILGRILIFLFFLVIYTFLLYLLGNYQDFLDSTQNILLRILESAGIIYVILALFFAAGRIVEWVIAKKNRGRDLLLSLIGLLLAGSLVLVAELILVIS